MTIAIGVVSLSLFGLFVWGSPPVIGDRAPGRHWLAWDLGLSLAFFLQHSGMVRKGFRARLALATAERHHGAIYTIASGLVLSVVVLGWQSSGTPLVVLEGPALWVARACSLLAVAAFFWTASALPSFDPLGIAPLKAQLRGAREPPPARLVAAGPYRWVRHPLYTCILVIMWSCPVVTADRLLFNATWTIWMIVAARLEERDLIARFGEEYRAYRREVPMLVPWRRPP